MQPNFFQQKPNTYYPQVQNTPVPGRAPSKRSKLLIIVALLITVAVVIGGGMLYLSQDPSKDTMVRAAARHKQLQEIVKTADESIISAELRKANADAGLLMATDDQELSKMLSKRGIGKLPADVIAREKDSKVADKLKSAATSGRFDETYKSTLSQKIDEQQALLRELATVAKQSEQAAITKNIEHLEAVQKQL